jgi:hypothetical protein
MGIGQKKPNEIGIVAFVDSRLLNGEATHDSKAADSNRHGSSNLLIQVAKNIQYHYFLFEGGIFGTCQLKIWNTILRMRMMPRNNNVIFIRTLLL